MRIQSALLCVLLLSTVSTSASAQDRLHPREGQVLDHIHTRFRWAPFEDLIDQYYLQVVEDNGSADPFVGATNVIGMIVPGTDPRVVVAENLEFGKNYVWRALGLVEPLPGVRTSSPVHRFSTKPLPSYAPDITITVPPGAGPVQPGVTIFNLRIGGNPPPGPMGYLLAVNEQGEFVWFYEYESRRTADFRQLDDGRFLWHLQSLVGIPGQLDGNLPGRAVEMTLNGGVTWLSPIDPINAWGHHEVQRMPNGNTLMLVYDNRDLPGLTPSDYLGDAIIEMDRHTKEIVGSWNTFDAYSIGDFNAQFGPGGDWTHGNAAIFNPLDGSVYFSARSLSRITRIDWATKSVLYNFGQDMVSGDVAFADNLFTFQHAVEPLPNGNILLFNNGNITEPLTDPRQSSAIEMSFDDPLNPTSATVVWRYDMVDDNGDEVFAPFLGDADRQPNGNTLIVAGPNGLVYEVDAASQLLWKMKVGEPFPLGAIYRADRIDSLVKDTPGDVDDDWDLDMHDLAGLQNGFQAPAVGFPEKLNDTNADGLLDDADFDHFFFWMTGPANYLGPFPN